MLKWVLLNKPLLQRFRASHKSNPSSVPRGIMDLYSTLGHVEFSNSCGGYTLCGGLKYLFL